MFLFCHFSKVNETTTLADLLKAGKEHKKRGLKEVPYRIIGTIKPSKSEFVARTKKISSPIVGCEELSKNSTTDSDGVLNCIEIINPDLKIKIIVYTAGEFYPLYAAAIIL